MYSLTDRQSRFNTYILMSISFYLLILSAELMPVVCFVPILSMAVSLSKCIAEII
jgi:multisubunit Na+/H+ antiporter MnhC subunit